MGHVPSKQGADLVLEHARWVRTLARALVHDEHDREDAIQDTWVAALEGRMRHQAAPRRWFARVLANFAGLHRRRERAVHAREERIARAEVEETDPSSLVARAEALQRAAAALLELDEPHRATLLLRFLEELSTDEIARRLGVPGSTVRNRIRRGLAKLRERLDDEHGGDRRAWATALAPGATAALWRPIAISTGVWTMTKTATVAAAAGLVLLLGTFAWRGLGRHAERAPRTPAPDTALRHAPVGATSGDEELAIAMPPAGRAVTSRAAVPFSAPPALAGTAVIQNLAEPVPDLGIWIETDGHANDITDEQPRQIGQTDERGRFVLNEVPALNQTLVFRGEGFVERRVGADEMPQEASDLFVVALLPLGILEMEVVNPDGTPVVDVSVALQALVTVGRQPGLGWVPGREFVGRTDALGHCTLVGIPCASALMIQIDGAFSNEPGMPSIDVQTRHLERRFVRRSRGSIGGIVTREDGTPVACPVELSSRGGHYVRRESTTDDEGRFSFADVPPGEAQLGFSALGLEASKLEIDVPAGRHLELEPIVIPTAVRVSGRVRSTFELRPADYVVELYREGERIAGPIWLDDEARFTAAVPPGPTLLRVMQVDIRLVQAGPTLRRDVARELGEASRLTLDAPAEGVEVWLDDRVGALGGRITALAADGDRDVLLRLLSPPNGPANSRNPSRPYSFERMLDLTNGRFHSQAIQAGTYVGLISVEGVGGALLPSLEIAPGLLTDMGAIELVAAGALGGMVRDATGHPIAGAVVTVGPRGGDARKAVTDTEGVYGLTSLPLGVLRIEATHVRLGGSARETILLGHEDATKDLTLLPRAELRGRLTRAGMPAGDAPVVLMRWEAANTYSYQSTTRTDGGGNFVFPDLEADQYGVSHGPLFRWIDLSDGGSHEIELASVEPTIEVVVIHQGIPLEGIRGLTLFAVDPGPDRGRVLEARMTAGNRVLIPPFAGRYHFVVTTERHAEPGLSGWGEATSDQAARLETACGELRLRSRDPHAPPPGVIVLDVGGVSTHPLLPMPLTARRSADGWRYRGIAHGSLLRLEGFNEDGDWITREWRFPSLPEATLSWP